MNPIYIIQYDNGQDYEDHSAWPILAAPTKEHAEQIVDEVNKWAEEVAQQMPALYEMPVEHTDKDWDLLEASEQIRREWLSKIQVPYGIQDFVALVIEHDSTFYKPYLKIVEIPFEGEKA